MIKIASTPLLVYVANEVGNDRIKKKIGSLEFCITIIIIIILMSIQGMGSIV